MDNETRDSLKAAGFAIGDAGDFLQLNEVERKLVELRLALSRKVRQLREDRGITQAALAKQIGSSQSRIAKLEAGEASVSLDLMLRGLFAVGGEVTGEMFANRSARKSRRAKTAAKVEQPTRTRRRIEA
jgi:DNA-binding XRE family transcriptional regulator